MVLKMGDTGKIHRKLSQIANRKNYSKINLTNKHSIIGGYCIFVSVIFLLICTKSSPMYPFNDWVDSNAFFTMGKGMMNGKVLYRDLFEQKGPLLYFIHGLSYLISNRTFLGVFIFEVFSFSIFLFYCHKIILLFLKSKYSFISLPLIGAIVLNLKNFTHGDSAEEFCVPLLAISLYYLINYFNNIYPSPISYKWLFINGIVAGNILWIKYSLLGFWLGWILMIYISMIKTKYYFKAIAGSMIFLLGMIVVTIPWIIYFGVNKAILDWLDTYILINIRSYARSLTLLERIVFIIYNISWNIINNAVFGILCCISIASLILSKKFVKSKLGKISLVVCSFLLALGVYGGGQGFIYYFLIFSPFVVLGFIVILDFMKLKYDHIITNVVSTIIIIISLIIIVPVTLYYNQNTYMLKLDKEELVQYKFASIINKTDNATLLNYGYLDEGFYTTTGITPNIRFFQKQNIYYSKYPLNIDEQNRYIKDKEIEFVVIRQKASGNVANVDIPYLFENYELIKEQKQVFEGYNFNYLLFRKKIK